MAPRAHRIGSIAVAVVVLLTACDPSPTTSPPTASTTARPSASPSTTPVPRPSPAFQASGVVPVDVRVIGGPLNARMGPSGVWTGSEVIIWGGYHSSGSIGRPETGYPRSGAAYTRYGDDWRAIAKAPIPGRYAHLAGWTGREMIIWGGYTENWRQGTPPVGAAYNPRTDRWRTIAQAPLRWGQTRTSTMTDSEWVVAITTKREIVVAAYDPAADSWRLLPPVPGAPTEQNQLVWTDVELVYLNGHEEMFRLAKGAATWERSIGGSFGPQAVWTGSELFAVPRYNDGSLARYDDAEGEWQSIPGPPLEGARLIWTGTHALLIADHEAPSYLYNPATEVWLELSWPQRLSIENHVSVWADDQLVEWGGWSGGDGAQPTDAGWALRPNLREVDLFDNPKTS